MQMADMGAASIAIMHMAGILTPQMPLALVAGICQEILVPLEVQLHATAGMAAKPYLAAVRAGAAIIALAVSPFAGGLSQPATESMLVALQDLGTPTAVKLAVLRAIASYFAPIRDQFRAAGQLNPRVMHVAPCSQLTLLPGGMLSNLLAQ